MKPAAPKFVPGEKIKDSSRSMLVFGSRTSVAPRVKGNEIASLHNSSDVVSINDSDSNSDTNGQVTTRAGRSSSLGEADDKFKSNNAYTNNLKARNLPMLPPRRPAESIVSPRKGTEPQNPAKEPQRLLPQVPTVSPPTSARARVTTVPLVVSEAVPPPAPLASVLSVVLAAAPAAAGVATPALSATARVPTPIQVPVRAPLVVRYFTVQEPPAEEKSVITTYNKGKVALKGSGSAIKNSINSKNTNSNAATVVTANINNVPISASISTNSSTTTNRTTNANVGANSGNKNNASGSANKANISSASGGSSTNVNVITHVGSKSNTKNNNNSSNNNNNINSSNANTNNNSSSNNNNSSNKKNNNNNDNNNTSGSNNGNSNISSSHTTSSTTTNSNTASSNAASSNATTSNTTTSNTATSNTASSNTTSSMNDISNSGSVSSSNSSSTKSAGPSKSGDATSGGSPRSSIAAKPIRSLPNRPIASSPGVETRRRESNIKPTQTPVALPPIVPPHHTESLVSKLVLELLEIVSNYLQDLELLQFTREGIIQNVAEVSSIEIEEIFRNVDEIVALTKNIQGKLQQSPLTHVHAFQVFMDSLPAFLSAYTPYCVRQKQACEKVKILSQQRSEFKAFLKRLNTKLSLDAYILKPVQHLCKCVTLMKEIRHVFVSAVASPSHKPDKEDANDNMETVIHNLELLIKQVDERQYESVMEQRYILLQRELEAAGSNLLLISPSRRLIRNGPLTGQEQKQKTKAPVYDGFYFLFSDVFVFAKKKKSTGLKISECISLAGEHAFLLLYNKGKWRFATYTYEEKLMLVVEMRETIERLNWEDDVARARADSTPAVMIPAKKKKRLSL